MDRIIRATGAKTPLRFVLADLTSTLNEIGKAHGALAFALELLGECGVASTLLSSGLKFPGTVSLRVDYSGDIRFVVADSTPQGLVRAMIPQADLLATKGFEPILSPQSLRVVKLNEDGKRVQESFVEAASTRMGVNLAAYLAQSEQTKSACGVLAKADPKTPGKLQFAVGFLVEAYPNTKDADLEIMDQVVRNLPPLDNFYNGSEYRLDDLLDELAGPYEYEIVREIVPQPYCPCSQSRILSGLASLPKAERVALAASGEIEVVCDFCRTRYLFSADDLAEML
jgi:molecular chaperone Hsp33